MGSIKDTAKNYVSKAKVKNISELSVVSVDLAVLDEDNAEWPYSYIEVGGERYKVPASVLANLKAILEENEALKTFKVKKTGEGLDARYTVIPLS
ncbi:MAG TPA: hypothetical protein ENI23_04215 [bacterium]|nr:hypothetical protein [bacterium]